MNRIKSNINHEPVFFMQNDTGNLDIPSKVDNEQLYGLKELYQNLDAGLADIQIGRTRKAEDVFADLEKELHLD